MSELEVLEKVQEIVRDVLDEEDVILTLDTTTDMVEDWDSLNHIQIVSEIQNYYGIKFSAKEMLSWDNVGDLCRTIVAKIG